MRHTATLAFGLIALALSSTASAADLKRAQEIVAGRCFMCHGMEGESSSALYPRLAGQHANYIARQLADFKSGRRKSETMASMAADLTPEEMAGLGAFFEKQPSKPHAPREADLAAFGRYIFTKGNTYSGVPACATCHGPKGYGTDQLPRLAGQQARYTEIQLKQFGQRERTNDNAVMHSVASKLTELEIKAVADFVSSLD